MTDFDKYVLSVISFMVILATAAIVYHYAIA